jgi:hypothetical protein
VCGCASTSSASPSASGSASAATPTATETATTTPTATTPPTTTPTATPTPTAIDTAIDVAGGDHLYSKSRFLWIRPHVGSLGWLGYLTLGGRVRVKDGDRASAYVGAGDGRQCRAWYRVEPRGFVCAGDHATLDPTDPVVVELRRHAARVSTPWPFAYGESLGAPIYHALPSPAEQTQRELGLEAHLRRVAEARTHDAGAPLDASLAGVDLSAAGKGPPALLDIGPTLGARGRYVIPGSTVAYVDALDWQGRTFLLTWDRGLVPKDKVRPYPRSSFAGVRLGGEASLPIAFFRERAHPKYRRTEGGGFAKTGESWPRHGWAALTGKREALGAESYLEARSGDWCLESDASVARPSAPPHTHPKRRKGRGTWIDIGIEAGVLVAYEGETPVYATLISPGRGGVPIPGVPTLDTASTPVGSFIVTGKMLTATMVSSSNSDIVHAEVPFTQNFDGPYALHGAYWHDAWGEKKSGGCVNLSARDAAWLFQFTEPALPEGWHAMRTGERLPATVVVLHR